jgi:hypothetical protein
MAEPMSNSDQASISSATGSSGDRIHSATPRSSTPKNLRTPTIQAPARGSSAPSDTPTAMSGSPMPSASAKSAEPPSTTSPVREICSSVPASGAETQGLTITAESTPIAATEAMRPPRSRPCVSCSRCCRKPGRRSS